MRRSTVFSLTREELCYLQQLHIYSILQNMGGVGSIAKGLMTDMDNGILFPTLDALRHRQKLFGKNSMSMFRILKRAAGLSTLTSSGKPLLSSATNARILVDPLLAAASEGIIGRGATSFAAMIRRMRIVERRNDEYDVIRAGRRVAIPAKDLVVGDVLVIKHGVILPCDGIYIAREKKDVLEVDEGILVRPEAVMGLDLDEAVRDEDEDAASVKRGVQRGGEEGGSSSGDDGGSGSEGGEKKKKMINASRLPQKSAGTFLAKRKNWGESMRVAAVDDREELIKGAFIKKKSILSPFLFAHTQVLKGKGKMLVTVVGSNSRTKMEFLESLQFLVLFKRMNALRKIVTNHFIPRKALLFDLPVGRRGFYVIHWICHTGDTLMLQLLLDNKIKVNLNRRTIRERMTPLSLAIKHNQDFVTPLLEAGADPNILDQYGRNSMFYAVRYGNWKLLRMLYEFGAKIQVTDKYNWHLLFYAVLHNPKVLKPLVALGDEDQRKKLQRENSFVRLLNQRDKDGNTCFLYAIVSGRSNATLDFLHALGADVNCQNLTGRNVLHYLCMADIHPYHLYFLKKRVLVFHCGDDLNVPDVFLKKKYRRSIDPLSIDLTYASLKRAMEKVVLDFGININEYDRAGLLPIHYLMVAARLNENQRLHRYVKKLLRLREQKKDDPEASVRNFRQILETFNSMDAFDRMTFIRYAFTLLISQGCSFDVATNKSNEQLGIHDVAML